mgnify:FL=1
MVLFIQSITLVICGKWIWGKQKEESVAVLKLERLYKLPRVKSVNRENEEEEGVDQAQLINLIELPYELHPSIVSEVIDTGNFKSVVRYLDGLYNLEYDVSKPLSLYMDLRVQ